MNPALVVRTDGTQFLRSATRRGSKQVLAIHGFQFHCEAWHDKNRGPGIITQRIALLIFYKPNDMLPVIAQWEEGLRAYNIELTGVNFEHQTSYKRIAVELKGEIIAPGLGYEMEDV